MKCLGKLMLYIVAKTVVVVAFCLYTVNQPFLVRMRRQSDMIMLVSEVCFCVSGKVPCIKNSKHQIVAISKHLCGAATGEIHV